MAAHPRSRGENLLFDNVGKELPGSSPLTRGKLSCMNSMGVCTRLIPAHAGKTSRHRSPTWSAAGSSPLTRGKLRLATLVTLGDGLIPAHAGKTEVARLHLRDAEAHPRSRGENDLLLPVNQFSERLIPAHAGKTRLGDPRRDGRRGSSPLTRGKRRSRSAAAARCAAHPRSRGENFWLSSHWRSEGGSSPLTRGKHFLTCAFTAQIDQILETLELAVSSGSYLIWVACATDAPQDPVRSIGLVLPSSRGAS